MAFRIIESGEASHTFTSDAPDREGMFLIAHRSSPYFAEIAALREFRLRDGEWVCEHPAWPTGFDSWASMASRGWRRVEEA